MGSGEEGLVVDEQNRRHFKADLGVNVMERRGSCRSPPGRSLRVFSGVSVCASPASSFEPLQSWQACCWDQSKRIPNNVHSL